MGKHKKEKTIDFIIRTGLLKKAIELEAKNKDLETEILALKSKVQNLENNVINLIQFVNNTRSSLRNSFRQVSQDMQLAFEIISMIRASMPTAAA